LKKTNRKIVIVSGGFDPIHVGHVRYIKDASKLGEILIVILNSDSFLNNKKGFVFMPFEERKEILFNLKQVTFVQDCIDDDETVCETLKLMRETFPLETIIFAKGGDRTFDNIPEVPVCQALGIEMVFDVGGGKVQSSQWLTKK
jgi:D-beta-D-heptose 7-phosphate kinase/D-beta-D-heptose 1-phosphate adenosyltransferase